MTQKSGLILSLLFVSIALSCMSKPSAKKQDLMQTENTTDTGNTFTPFALVELFTSEGCSSCPPADKLLTELPSLIQNENLYLLAFHVDYWNRLGWKDRFSDASYSERQQIYCDKLQSSAYTPQMIVNGKNVFVGSDKSKSLKYIGDALKQNASVKIAGNAKPGEGNSVVVNYALSGEIEGQEIHIALVEKENQTQVKNGENGGRTLKHANIVRAFITKDAGDTEGNVSIIIPDDVAKDNISICIFSQDKHSGAVTGAAVASVM